MDLSVDVWSLYQPLDKTKGGIAAALNEQK